MIISRLDKIIENNVTASAQKGNEAQKIAILQDISETLAMIYDKLCGMNPVSDATIPIESMAFVIQASDLEKYKDTIHYETIDYADGYGVTFERYEEEEIIDVKNNEKRYICYAILNAFGEEMKLNLLDYGKKWRCWNIKPTETERSKEKWKK